MRIDFAKLDELEAAGASAKVIITMLRQDFAAYEAKKLPKRAADNARNATNRGEKPKRCETQRSEANRGESPKPFLRFWATYPKRQGQNPKRVAQQKFELALKGGADPEAIISAVGRFAEEARKDGTFGTPYVPQAVKWLNQRRWEDEEPKTEVSTTQFYAAAASPELEAWDDYRRGSEGKGYPRDAKGGWNFPTQWPPDHQSEAA